MHPNRIHVVVSVVRDVSVPISLFLDLVPILIHCNAVQRKGTPDRFLEGVCSNFLARTMPPLTDGSGKRLDGTRVCSCD